MTKNREEADRLLMADAIIEDLKQFNRLRAVEPPLSVRDIAYRMVWHVKDVRWLLKKIRDRREDVEIIQRNKAIIELRLQGLTFGQISKKLDISKGTIAGVVARNKERIALGRREGR